MQVMFWIWLIIVLKLPMIWIAWVIYRAIKDTPDQVVGEGEGGSGVRFDPGPRKRGPDDGRPWKRGPRRGDSGHEEAARKRGKQPVTEAIAEHSDAG